MKLFIKTSKSCAVIYFLGKKRCISCWTRCRILIMILAFACWLSLQFQANSIPFTAWNFCSQPIVGRSGVGGVLLDKLAVKTRYLPGWQISMSDSVAYIREQDFACRSFLRPLATSILFLQSTYLDILRWKTGHWQGICRQTHSKSQLFG